MGGKMKYKINRTTSYFFAIVAILLYTLGVVLSHVSESIFKYLGIVCETISMLYTSVNVLRSLKCNSNTKNHVTPLFVDRIETIEYCIFKLYNIICEKQENNFISIKCISTNSIGKTEMLKKLQQILTNSKSAKKYLPEKAYLKCRKIHKHIGDVYFEHYTEDSIFSKIESYPMTLNRYDVVIIDDMPAIDFIPVDRKNLIVIFCRKVNCVDNDVVLNCISEADLLNLCELCKQKIDKDLAKRIIEYSKGDMNIITDIVKTADNINNFKTYTAAVYEIKCTIEHKMYNEAAELLSKAKNNSKLFFTSKVNLQLDILSADLLHYQNQYKEAKEAFIAISAMDLDNETHIEVLERQCHILRHTGEFREALHICELLPETLKLPRMLGLYFMAYAKYEEKKYYDCAIQTLEKINKDLDKYVTRQHDSFHTYKAVKEIYEKRFKEAHRTIDIVINLYESHNSKLITNCYFIKAEIYRHSKQYKMACKYYQKCFNVYELNGDFDIYTLSYVMITYLNAAYNIGYKCTFDILGKDVLDRTQNLGMSYNQKLIFKLNEYCKTNTLKQQKDNIQQFFEKFVFIIP